MLDTDFSVSRWKLELGSVGCDVLCLMWRTALIRASGPRASTLQSPDSYHRGVANAYLNAKLHSSIPGGSHSSSRGSLRDQCTALHDAHNIRELLQSVWAT